jgi:hypothetical protein
MNTKTVLALALIVLFCAASADARDDRLRFPLASALSTPDAKTKLDPKIRLYFGKTKYPEPAQRSGVFTANKKTNFFNKSDKEGCEWVFLSAAISLQARARELGGNAVVNIASVLKNQEFISETEYECGAGNVVGGVALRGEIATIR